MCVCVLTTRELESNVAIVILGELTGNGWQGCGWRGDFLLPISLESMAVPPSALTIGEVNQLTRKFLGAASIFGPDAGVRTCLPVVCVLIYPTRRSP